MLEHKVFVRRGMELVRLARNNGNHPVGALLVADNKVILETENYVVSENNPTLHVELNLGQRAWRELPDEMIEKSTLYTSPEPCTMCTGAISW